MKTIISIVALGLALLFISHPLLSQSEGKVIDSLKNQLRQSSDSVLYLEGLAYEYKFSDPDSSYKYAQLHLEAARSLNNQKQIAQGHNSLANAYQVMSQSDSSILHNKLSLDIKLALGDSLGVADSYNNLGIINDEMGRFSTATSYYLKALPLYEKYTQDSFKLAGTINNLGIVFKNQRAYKSAIEYYKRSLVIYENIGSDFGVAATKGNIASMYLKTKDYDQSIEMSKQALADYRLLGYRRYEPYSLHNIGIAQFELGKSLPALASLKEATQIYRETKNNVELASVHVDLAKLYNAQEQWTKAIQSGDDAISYSKDANAQGYETAALGQLGYAHLGKGNKLKAAELFKQYDMAKEKLFESDKTKTIFQLQTEYETNKKEQQIELQQLELESKVSINKFQKGLFASLVLGILAGGVLLYNRFRYRKKIEIQTIQLKAQQDEYSAMFLGQENERKRIARDLHDGLGQILSTARMNVSVLDESISKKEDIEILENSIKLIDRAVTEVRNVSHDLMPKTLSEKGLIPALEEIKKRIDSGGKYTMHISINSDALDLSEGARIQVYRIIQELMNNSIKYAEGDVIKVKISSLEDNVFINISDNGKGISEKELDNSQGIGWSNIRSRTQLLGGNIALNNQDHSGTHFLLTLPKSA